MRPRSKRHPEQSVPSLLALSTIGFSGMLRAYLPAPRQQSRPPAALSLSPFQCIDPTKPTFQNCTPRGVRSSVNSFPAMEEEINSICASSAERHTWRRQGERQITGKHAVLPRGTGYTVHTGEGGRRRGGASLSREASCIFLYLSTKSHKRWPVSRLRTAPDM